MRHAANRLRVGSDPCQALGCECRKNLALEPATMTSRNLPPKLISEVPMASGVMRRTVLARSRVCASSMVRSGGVLVIALPGLNPPVCERPGSTMTRLVPSDENSSDHIPPCAVTECGQNDHGRHADGHCQCQQRRAQRVACPRVTGKADQVGCAYICWEAIAHGEKRSMSNEKYREVLTRSLFSLCSQCFILLPLNRVSTRRLPSATDGEHGRRGGVVGDDD